MASPIFARDFASVLRRKRTHVVLGGFLVVLFAVLLASWPIVGADAASSGRRAFFLIALIELAAAGVLGPALAAPSIAVERERETLGLLALAGTSAGRIVAGAALGRFAVAALFVVLALPMTAALFAIGGLSFSEWALVSVAALALAALGTGLGVACSATVKRAEVATIQAFGILLALTMAPLLVERAGGFPARFLSPFAWYVALEDPLAATGQVQFRGAWIAPCAQALLGAAGVALGAWLLGRRGFLPIHGAEGPRRPALRMLARLRSRGGPIGLHSALGPEVAAIRWRERSARGLSDAALAVILFTGVLAFELVPASAGRASLRGIAALVLAAIVTVVASVLGAGAIARERDEKTLEMLAAAPIEAEQLLAGKLLGMVRGLMVGAAALVAHLGLGALRGEVDPVVPLVAALTVPPALALHAVVGLSLSSHAASAIGAVTRSLLAAIVAGALAFGGGCLFLGVSPVVLVGGLLGIVPVQGMGGLGLGSGVALAAGTALLAAAISLVAWNHLRARFDALLGRAALDLLELPDRIMRPPSAREGSAAGALGGMAPRVARRPARQAAVQAEDTVSERDRPMAERTLSFVKPDGVQRRLVGKIVQRFEEKGLKIVGMKLMTIPLALAEKHYAEHKGKKFYDGLVKFVTGGPVVLLCLEGFQAIKVVRDMMGKTFGYDAAPGTIRGDFGISNQYNLVHGSDSPESAAREIELYFKPEELVRYEMPDQMWMAAE